MVSSKTHFVMQCAIALSCLGCSHSGPDIATVEGTVTLDGKPLPHATVVFTPEEGRPAGARTDENGHYVLNFSEGRKGAIPGKNKVMIMTAMDAAKDEEGNDIPASKEKLPAKYNTETTLEFTVEPGKNNVADFNLDSGGKIVQAQ